MLVENESQYQFLANQSNVFFASILSIRAIHNLSRLALDSIARLWTRPWRAFNWLPFDAYSL